MEDVTKIILRVLGEVKNLELKGEGRIRTEVALANQYLQEAGVSLPSQKIEALISNNREEMH